MSGSVLSLLCLLGANSEGELSIIAATLSYTIKGEVFGLDNRELSYERNQGNGFVLREEERECYAQPYGGP